MNKDTELLLDKFVGSLNKCQVLLKEVKYVALLGSASSGEEISNYSDIDILLVFKSDRYGCIKSRALEKLRGIAELVSRGAAMPLSILTHTVREFEIYVDFEYLKHYSFGKVLYGSQCGYDRMFRSIIQQKNLSPQDLHIFILKNLYHARFNLFRKYVSYNEFNTSGYVQTILKLFIDNTIEICDWALISKGYWATRKSEIVKKFMALFPNVKQGCVPASALKIRNSWGRPMSIKSADKFLKNTVQFINGTIEAVENER